MSSLTLAHLMSLTRDEVSQWTARNTKLAWAGVMVIVQAFPLVQAGIATRCYMTAESETRGLIMAGIQPLGLVLAYYWWFGSSISIHGLHARSLLEYYLGVLGFGGNFRKLFPGKFVKREAEN